MSANGAAPVLCPSARRAHVALVMARLKFAIAQALPMSDRLDVRARAPPELAKAALSSGLTARDQIARLTLGASEGREASACS